MTRLNLAATAAACLMMLAACGGGGGDTPSTPAPTPTPTPTATTYTVGVSVTSQIGAGESFEFSLGGTERVTLTAASPTGTFAALASGSSYTVTQLSGPRACTLSANRTGTLSGNVTATADCGAAPSGSSLSGKFYGPGGAQATLLNNGGDALSVAVPTPFAYDSKTFTFATPLADGSAYAVTVGSAGSNLTCRAFQAASGTMPVADGRVRVGCETTVDRVTRNDDNSRLLTFFESTSPVIGGANDAIGATTVGYGEGRFVVFVSDAAIAGATGRARQIFLRDRFTGELRLISALNGTEGNGASDNAAISADGLTIAFESSASNLVTGDTNGVSDVFVYSLITSTLTRASIGAGGTQYTSPSGKPALSGDGRVVAFESIKSNVTTNVAGSDNTTIVVRRDQTSGSTTVISRNLSGQAVGGLVPRLSDDGNRVVFWSFAADLVTGDTNGLWDIFVADVSAGTMKRVSLTSTGGERNAGTESASRVVAPAISGDGRWVAWASTASNVVPGDTNGSQDVFVVDTQTGAVQRASVASNGTQANADAPIGQGERLSLSRDGTWVAFTSAAGNLGVASNSGVQNVFLHNRVTGETRAVTNQTTSGSVGSAPGLSREAAYVVFGASSSLDPRFAGSGQFVHFTDLARAFYWLVD